MTIRCLFKNSKDLQEQQLLQLVYRRTLQRLNVVDRDDPSREAVARKSKSKRECNDTLVTGAQHGG